MTAQDTGIHESESNIFAELGLPDADRHFLKAQLVAEIFRLTKAEGLTQAKAASRMGISQPEVSRLFRGHFREYSVTWRSSPDPRKRPEAKARSHSATKLPDTLHRRLK